MRPLPIRYLVTAMALAFAMIVIYAEPSPRSVLSEPSIAGGPDVIVGDIPQVLRHGTLGNETAFTIGTTSCNIGTARLSWLAGPSSNQHPVIAQNLYRLFEGRLEHIGMSWLKHGFSVSAGNLCNPGHRCADVGFDFLGVNCSDPYSANLNGMHDGLGPRSEINATTGEFPASNRILPMPRTVLDGRIRVKNDLIDPAQNVGARYFVEAQYVHPQDARAGNGQNNNSYREVTVRQRPGEFLLEFPSGSTTVREKCVIDAWASVHADVVVKHVDVPRDGRFTIGMRAMPLAGGKFIVNVAVQNINSHRSAKAVKLNFPQGSPTSLGFHDIDYQHEAYSGQDWTPSTAVGFARWTTEDFTVNPDANALRWSTVYTFWCTSDNKPTSLEIELFRPGQQGDPDKVSTDLDPIELRPQIAAELPKPEAWINIERDIHVGELSAEKPFSVSCSYPQGYRVTMKEVTSSSKDIAVVLATSETDKSKSQIMVRPQDKPKQYGYFESILKVIPNSDSEQPVYVRVYGKLKDK